MNNPFPYSLDNKRYHTLNYHFRKLFNNKVCKVPLSLGTTCPNRDGTKGTGGCTYCSSEGGGGAQSENKLSLDEQFSISAQPLLRKWPNALTMAYFQSYTNTYVPYDTFVQAVETVLNIPSVIGINIATRPDSLSADIVKYLAELSTKTYLIVELGLQTIHEKTAKHINRCHTYSEFLEGYSCLTELGINVCVHLINGLPFETSQMMLESATEVAKLNPHSIKIHMLHIIKDTTLAKQYEKEPFALLSEHEYVDILCNQLEVIPASTVIQRITGDPIAGDLVAPQWTLNKLWVRNAIDKEFAKRNSFQGISFND